MKRFPCSVIVVRLVRGSELEMLHRSARLFPIGAIIGSFFSDDDVMHMALAEAGKSLADKRRLLLQIRNGLTSAIAHAGLHSAHHLINMRRQQSFIRHP